MDEVIAEWCVGFRYEDLEDPEKPSSIVYPKVRDLYYAPLIALLLYCLRRIFERTIAKPIAKSFSLSDGTERKPPRPSPYLDEYHKIQSRNPSPEEVRMLAKKMDWTADNVRKWFRRTRNLTRPSIQKKFCESCWRFTFYMSSVLYGISVLRQKPYLWELKYCWADYPRQSVEQPIYYYYMMQASFYLSLLATLATDVQRKDTKENFIHHIVTLLLIFLSYIINNVRIGSIVMMLHDVSDIFLEGAKCWIYLRQKKSSDFCFAMLIITFFITRLVIFPFWIIHSALRDYPVDMRDKTYKISVALLIVLQILHVFWFCLIMNQAYARTTKEQAVHDCRSDNEEDSSGDEDGK